MTMEGMRCFHRGHHHSYSLREQRLIWEKLGGPEKKTDAVSEREKKKESKEGPTSDRETKEQAEKRQQEEEARNKTRLDALSTKIQKQLDQAKAVFTGDRGVQRTQEGLVAGTERDAARKMREKSPRAASIAQREASGEAATAERHADKALEAQALIRRLEADLITVNRLGTKPLSVDPTLSQLERRYGEAPTAPSGAPTPRPALDHRPGAPVRGKPGVEQIQPPAAGPVGGFTLGGPAATREAGVRFASHTPERRTETPQSPEVSSTQIDRLLGGLDRSNPQTQRLEAAYRSLNPNERIAVDRLIVPLNPLERQQLVTSITDLPPVARSTFEKGMHQIQSVEELRAIVDMGRWLVAAEGRVGALMKILREGGPASLNDPKALEKLSPKEREIITEFKETFPTGPGLMDRMGNALLAAPGGSPEAEHKAQEEQDRQTLEAARKTLTETDVEGAPNKDKAREMLVSKLMMAGIDADSAEAAIGPPKSPDKLKMAEPGFARMATFLVGIVRHFGAMFGKVEKKGEGGGESKEEETKQALALQVEKLNTHKANHLLDFKTEEAQVQGGAKRTDLLIVLKNGKKPDDLKSLGDPTKIAGTLGATPDGREAGKFRIENVTPDKLVAIEKIFDQKQINDIDAIQNANFTPEDREGVKNALKTPSQWVKGGAEGYEYFAKDGKVIAQHESGKPCREFDGKDMKQVTGKYFDTQSGGFKDVPTDIVKFAYNKETRTWGPRTGDANEVKETPDRKKLRYALALAEAFNEAGGAHVSFGPSNSWAQVAKGIHAALNSGKFRESLALEVADNGTLEATDTTGDFLWMGEFDVMKGWGQTLQGNPEFAVRNLMDIKTEDLDDTSKNGISNLKTLLRQKLPDLGSTTA